MNTTLKKRLQIGGWIVGTGALIAVAAIGGPALGQAIRPAAPEPTPTVAVASPSPTPTVTPTPTPIPTVEAVVEAPPVVEAPADPGPDLCPAGTTSQRSDGYNDLACAPDLCLSGIAIPDPAHPECDYFYEPAYYR